MLADGEANIIDSDMSYTNVGENTEENDNTSDTSETVDDITPEEVPSNANDYDTADAEFDEIDNVEPVEETPSVHSAEASVDDIVNNEAEENATSTDETVVNGENSHTYNLRGRSNINYRSMRRYGETQVMQFQK